MKEKQLSRQGIGEQSPWFHCSTAKPGVEGHTCHPSTWEVEVGGSGAEGQHGLHACISESSSSPLMVLVWDSGSQAWPKAVSPTAPSCWPSTDLS